MSPSPDPGSSVTPGTRDVDSINDGEETQEDKEEDELGKSHPTYLK